MLNLSPDTQTVPASNASLGLNFAVSGPGDNSSNAGGGGTSSSSGPIDSADPLSGARTGTGSIVGLGIISSARHPLICVFHLLFKVLTLFT